MIQLPLKQNTLARRCPMLLFLPIALMATGCRGRTAAEKTEMVTEHVAVATTDEAEGITEPAVVVTTDAAEGDTEPVVEATTDPAEWLRNLRIPRTEEEIKRGHKAEAEAFIAGHEYWKEHWNAGFVDTSGWLYDRLWERGWFSGRGKENVVAQVIVTGAPPPFDGYFSFKESEGWGIAPCSFEMTEGGEAFTLSVKYDDMNIFFYRNDEKEPVLIYPIEYEWWNEWVTEVYYLTFYYDKGMSDTILVDIKKEGGVSWFPSVDCYKWNRRSRQFEFWFGGLGGVHEKYKFYTADAMHGSAFEGSSDYSTIDDGKWTASVHRLEDYKYSGVTFCSFWYEIGEEYVGEGDDKKVIFPIDFDSLSQEEQAPYKEAFDRALDKLEAIAGTWGSD